MNDQEAMRHALACARSVEGRPSPRPLVGASVAQGSVITGRGATAPPSGPPAEPQTLEQARTTARGSTLSTTLEPCSIQRHTPPCTMAIIAAGVRRVVVGTHAPHPLVHEQGVAQLRAASIEVTVLDHDLEALEARELIRPFAYAITRGRPYITAKWAMTLDGKLSSSPDDALWTSQPDARSWVQDLRDRVDALMIGAKTARRDNPRLTVRIPCEQRRRARTVRATPPMRVILTTGGDLPEHLTLLQPELAGGTCTIVGETCTNAAQQRLAGSGAQVLTVAVNERGQVDLPSALQVLGQRVIRHALLEGSGRLLGSAFDDGCIDHVAAFVAPTLIGGSKAPSPLSGRGLINMEQARQLLNVQTTFFGTDILIEGDIANRR